LKKNHLEIIFRYNNNDLIFKLYIKNLKIHIRTLNVYIHVNLFSIWEYLQDLTNRGKTIIITTHYIEEARLANTVNLLLMLIFEIKCL